MVLSSLMAVAAWYASKGFIVYSLMSMDAVRHISGVRGIHLTLFMWVMALVAWTSSLRMSLLKNQKMISWSVAVEA